MPSHDGTRTKFKLRSSSFHQLYCFLTRQVLDVETNHQHTGEATLNLLLQALIVVRVVAVAKHTGSFHFLLIILDDVDSAECYHATKECSVLLRLHIILLDNTERSLITLADSIHLMT